MVVYYRGPDAKITSRAIETWCPQYQYFAIAELAEVRIGQAPPGPVDMRSTGVAVGLLAVGAASLACLPTAGGCLVMTALTVGAGFAGLHAIRLRHAWYVITALHRGTAVCVYRTTDERIFGQVRRGLLRALEAHEDG